MYSMTGFGQAERAFETMEVSVEVRTLNGRYLDMKLRLPHGARFLEARMRQVVREKLGRGRVDLSLEINWKSQARYRIDEGLVKNYLAMVDQLRSLGVGGELDVAGCLRLSGTLVANQPGAEIHDCSDDLLAVAGEALDRVVEARQAEGARLLEDLTARIRSLERTVKEIGGHAAEVFDQARAKLTKRLEEMNLSFAADQGRLAEEIAYYAARAEISEEITRMRSHLVRFSHQLQDPGSEPRGKSLDFLCQEMHREVTTILAKSSLPHVSSLALEAKGEIEKIREQVQNVE